MIRTVAAASLLLVWLPFGLTTQSKGVVVLQEDAADGFVSGEESPPFPSVTSWLGLFDEDGRSTLRPVALEWSSTREDEYVLHELSTTPAGAVLLLGDVPFLSEGPARTVVRWSASLSRAEPELALELEGRRYVVRLAGAEGTGCDAVVTLSDGETTQRLYEPSPDVCDEPHFEVAWAGDLDRDGRLDLVATFSPKYSDHTRRLLLSSAAPSGELVGEAARYERFAQ